jgi:mannitol/fructose-specific phosphotransferase system IIA component (Ntr-type)
VRRWIAHRAAWLGRLDAMGLFQRLFDHIPGVYFFAKDHDGHIEVLSGLAEMLSDDAQVNFLLNASDAGRIHEYLASGL